MRGLVLAAIVLLAFACNGGGEGLPAATPGPSPSATATASSTSTPETTAEPEIAYVRADEADVWLMAADGSGKRNLTQGGCPYGSRLYWSPQGDRIACIGGVDEPQVETRLLIFSLDGQVTLRLQHAGYFFGWPPLSWSPSGQRLAYVIQEDAPWAEGPEQWSAETPILMVVDAAQGTLRSVPGGEWPQWSSDADRLAYHQAVDDTLVVYDPASGQEETLANGLRPLVWVLGGKKLLVAANYQEQEEGRATYEANLLDPATGQMTRTPDLDSPFFWLSPDEDTVAFYASGARDYRLAMLNLSSLQLTPIADSSIGYGSDYIPQNQLAFSPDGSEVYWADLGGSVPPAIYKANRDGSGLTKVLDLPGWFAGFSPDLKSILYYIFHRPEDANKWPNGLWASNIDGSDARLLAEQEQVSWAAWRPTP